MKLPTYTMPKSKHKNQQKGISWLTEDVRIIFMNRLKNLLGTWGVSLHHVGTCVLIPVEWENLDPHEIMDTFSEATCPPEGKYAKRLVGSYPFSLVYVSIIYTNHDI